MYSGGVGLAGRQQYPDCGAEAEITAVTARRKGWGDENGVQNPQHVAMAMTVEMSELLEHFQWLSAEDVDRLLAGGDPERVALIGEEFADVLMYGLQLADALHIDATQQILRQDRHRGSPEREARRAEALRRGVCARQGGAWTPILF